jgi:hypothetical protein
MLRELGIPTKIEWCQLSDKDDSACFCDFGLIDLEFSPRSELKKIQGSPPAI